MSLQSWILGRIAALMVLACIHVSATAAGELPRGLKFTLTDQHGRAFTEADLRAKPSLVHFGFTSCPVVCPTTLYEVASRMRELGPAVDGINFVFVTVDPARDTPAYLKTYIESFDSRIIGLSGDTSQIAALAGAVGAQFSRIEGSDGSYTMDHSVNGFLIDTRGTVSELYVGVGAKEAIVDRKLRELATFARRRDGARNASDVN